MRGGRPAGVKGKGVTPPASRSRSPESVVEIPESVITIPAPAIMIASTVPNTRSHMPKVRWSIGRPTPAARRS